MIGRLCALGCTTVLIALLSGCVGLTGTTGNQPPPPSGGLQNINHIVVLIQENRSFDSYFGAMRGYWAANGVPDQQFDGLAQFNPPADPANAPTVPGCDPAFPFAPPSTNPFCQIDSASPLVASFHFKSMCIENTSPSWNEAHHDWNLHDPTSSTFVGDGFVDTAANFARQHTQGGGPAPFFDVNGNRAMGYYDWTDLNYYYALATAFATSDTWFSPVMSRTPPNRDYLLGGTTHGYAYQVGSNPPLNSAKIPTPTIFEELDAAGVSWKIYVPTQATRCASTPTDVACLLHFTYIHDFQFGAKVAANPSAYANKIVPLSQYFNDATTGNLPSVALIEPASNAKLDEHPLDFDPAPGTQAIGSVQAGAAWVSTLINAMMCGQNGPPSGTCDPTQAPSWKDSVFILTWDEFGGLYDHVAPVQMGSPDGIGPVDLFSNDPCFGAVTANTICDFSYTGFRVPMVVISPFTKPNFVSHQNRDYTAILKLIEDRFGVAALSNRDKNQVGMDDANTGFFDFSTVPWKTPPTTLPQQANLGPSACFVNPPPP